MVPPPAAGQLVHELKAAPGYVLDRSEAAPGQGLGRRPGHQRRRAVPPAAGAVEALADEFAADAEAAQGEPQFGPADLRGLRDLRGWAGGLKPPPPHVLAPGHRTRPP